MKLRIDLFNGSFNTLIWIHALQLIMMPVCLSVVPWEWLACTPPGGGQDGASEAIHLASLYTCLITLEDRHTSVTWKPGPEWLTYYWTWLVSFSLICLIHQPTKVIMQVEILHVTKSTKISVRNICPGVILPGNIHLSIWNKSWLFFDPTFFLIQNLIWVQSFLTNEITYVFRL